MTLVSLLLEGPDHSFGPVYHGGSWDGKKPIKTNGRGALGVGAYFTPLKEKAQGYANENGGFLISAFLKINRPLVVHLIKGEHPCIEALTLLGFSFDKASALVEKVEEKYGYMGSEIKNLALKQGYDGIFQYHNDKLLEIVVWSSQQVEVIKE